MDGIIPDHASDAYVGTVIRDGSEITREGKDGGSGCLESIPKELVQWLTDCEPVGRQTTAGLWLPTPM